jgi:hypothetical protein
MIAITTMPLKGLPKTTKLFENLALGQGAQGSPGKSRTAIRTQSERKNLERLEASVAQKQTVREDRTDCLDELKADSANGKPFPLCHWLRDQQEFRATTTGAAQDLVVKNKWNETKDSIPFSVAVAISQMEQIGLAFVIHAIFTLAPVMIAFGVTDYSLQLIERRHLVMLKTHRW